MSKATQSLKSIFTDLKKKLGQVGNQADLRAVGELSAEIIRERTRRGYGVAKQGGGQSRLKPLAKSTIKKRQYLAKRGLLSGLTSPATSNLTLTAQMLDSLSVVNVTKNTVSIAPRGRRSDSRIGNAKVAEYQIDQGRVFNNLSKNEYKTVVDFYKARIEKIFKR